MKDHRDRGRGAPLYDDARRRCSRREEAHPGKPIRSVVNSHFHFDHAGGLRTAVAEGATIITHPRSRAYFEKAVANPNRVSPDLLAKSGKRRRSSARDEKMVLSDAGALSKSITSRTASTRCLS